MPAFQTREGRFMTSSSAARPCSLWLLTTVSGFLTSPAVVRSQHTQSASDSPRQVITRIHAMTDDAECRRLENGDISARMQAAKRLGEMKAKRAVPQLITALNDPNPYVRGWAAWALGEIGEPSTVDALITAFVKYRRTVAGPVVYKETKCWTEMVEALKKLTGQDFGFNAAKWVEWNEKRKTTS
jgi:hypothetical protein